MHATWWEENEINRKPKLTILMKEHSSSEMAMDLMIFLQPLILDYVQYVFSCIKKALLQVLGEHGEGADYYNTPYGGFP